jgi:glycine/D-amino acid oxidase-like deaminating enzyme
MHNVVETDIAILGGGIAGLWLLNRLRQLGFGAILLESNTLGGGQTHKAQGIIHGGTKYALQGTLTEAAAAIADMPRVWQLCLEGKGVIDLSNVPILSPYQYLFSTNKLAGKLAGFFATMALQGKVTPLESAAYPLVFQHPTFKGLVYALEEMAIDLHALIRELVKPNQDVIFKINPMQETELQVDVNSRLISLEVKVAQSDPIQIKAKKYIFTAGSGNEILLKKISHPALAMQRRPLHMVVVKTDFTYPVFAHCLGIGATPRITITTHKAHDGKIIWYLGGQIAEEGVQYDSAKQTSIAKQELIALFPWLDFSNARFASFLVDRAEPMQPGGKRPDGAYLKEIENSIIAWPTKLAFAPKLADDIIHCLMQSNIKEGVLDTRALREFPMPPLATPIWDELL